MSTYARSGSAASGVDSEKLRVEAPAEGGRTDGRNRSSGQLAWQPRAVGANEAELIWANEVALVQAQTRHGVLDTPSVLETAGEVW